jgi:RNase P protein component
MVKAILGVYILERKHKGAEKLHRNYIRRACTKILKAKLEKETYNIFSEDQSGFRAGRSCTDNLFILQQILEKRKGVNEETRLAIVDLEKAYDYVPRCKLWEAFKRYSSRRRSNKTAI